MLQHFRPAIVLIVVFTLVTGVAFPLGFSGAATALVPGLAGGSLVERDGKVVGSALIGQNFSSDRYFHPRPSATTDTDPNDATKTISVPYDASASGASNLGPTSQALLDRVKGDMGAAGPAPVPADAVTASASGLDPEISPENAERQVARVAAARGMAVDRVQGLVAAHSAGRTLGVFGQPGVNVLALNLALDAGEAR